MFLSLTLTLVFHLTELVSAVEQVVLEEFFEIEIEMFFKWKSAPK